MKNIKKILLITLALATLFLLAACSDTVSEPDVDSASTPSPEALVNGFSGPRYGTGLECSLIKNEQGRQGCESQINDMIGNMVENEVISRFDLARCKELEKEIGTNCQTIISESGVEGPISDDEMANFSEAVQGTFTEPEAENEAPLLFPTYDSGKCANLKTPGYKEYCEKQIDWQLKQAKFEQIIQSGDIKRCDELTDGLLDQCKMFFGEVPSIQPVVEPVLDEPGLEPGLAPEELVEEPALKEPAEEIITPETE